MTTTEKTPSYRETVFLGWRHVDGRSLTPNDIVGYNFKDFFRDGRYLGPDAEGVYPHYKLTAE